MLVFSKIRFIIFVGELIGNEYFANKLALRNKPLAEKMFNKIKDLLTGKGDKIDNQTRKYLNKVYKSFAKALDKSVGGYSLSNLDGDDKKETEKDINENIDSEVETRYNKKRKSGLIDNVFPPYNESFSDANERATRWAKKETVKEGWQRLISYHDRWYIIEKFSNMDNGYLIVESVKKSEYDKKAREIKSYEGDVSYGESIDEGISINENGGRKQGIDSDKAQNERSDIGISKMAQEGSSGERSREASGRNNGESRGNFKSDDVRHSLSDERYAELAKDPKKNERELSAMVEEAAREAGYTVDFSWRMQHKAPNSKEDVSLANLKESGLVPNDFWEHPEWYTYSAEERESYYKVKKAIETLERRKSEGKTADAYMWVYRAVDKTVNTKEDYFRNGDWVTPSYDYAVNEGKTNPNGYRIIKHSVNIKNLYWDGNSIAELGFDDGKNYAYADTVNNRKLLDIVTYDDGGNIIPLSKRFKRRNADVRYSLKDSEGRTLTEAQQNFFKDSKSINQDGELLTLYHGGFSGNVFNGRGKGFTYNPNAIYLTDSKQVAEAFANGGVTREFYANIKNPIVLDAQGRSYVDIPIPEDAPESLKEYFYETADMDNLPVYAEKYGYDGVIVYNVKEGVGGEPMTEVVALQSNQVKLTTNENPTFNPDIRYSKSASGKSKDRVTPKITADMPDAERAEILSKKKVLAPIYTGQADATILANKDKLESGKVGIVAGVIQKLGEDFGVVGEEINIEDVEVVITLSKSNLRKSVTAEATPGQLAKLIPVLKDTARSAIGIERHDNRYFFDSDTVYFDNLLGGYIDGNDLVPVRFGLKHSRTGNVVLYVVVDQNKIPLSSLTEIKKTEVVKTPAANADPEVSRSVTYSIAQIIEFVNSGDLLRYIPDEMLTEAQKTTKYEAIAKTIERTNAKNDERYAEYISNGDLDAAKQMVFNAAKAAGYTIEGYHGTRQTFTAFSSESKGSNTRTETSKRMFFAADKATANSYYPYGVMQTIHEQHPEWAWADPEKVKVKGNLYHLFIKMSNPLTVDVADYDYAAHRDNADSWMEFVAQAEANHNDGIILLNAMDNQLDTSARASTVYMFAQPSQAKSAETITYDDKGNIIPISSRFNDKNPDIRYSKPKKDIYKNISSKFNESIKRRTVNESMLKRYTLTDSDKIITGIMKGLGFYDEYSDIESVVSLTGKSKAEAIRALTDGRKKRARVIDFMKDIEICARL